MVPEANSRVPSPSFPSPPRSHAGSARAWNPSPFDSAHFPNVPSFYAASYDPSFDAASIWSALKNSKKPDTDLLTRTIIGVSHTPSKLPILRQKYEEVYAENIKTTIKSGTSGPYRLALLRLIVGPWESEADWLNSYGKRDYKNDASFLPMDDKMIAEAIFGKQPDEIEQIKTAFAISNPGVSLETVIEDLYPGSAQHSTGPSYGVIVDAVSSPGIVFGRAALQVLRAHREYETAKTVSLLNVDHLLTREAKLMGDVEDLYRAEKRLGGPGSINKYLDQNLLLELVLNKSDIYLRDLYTRFRERHVRELVDVITSRDRVLVGSAGVLPNNLVMSLLRSMPWTSLTSIKYQIYALNHAFTGITANSKAARDAKLLHDTLGILGIQDTRLVARAVRLHFDQAHLRRVKEAYRARYGKDILERARKEVKRGPYRDLMVKLLEGSVGGNQNDRLSLPRS